MLYKGREQGDGHPKEATQRRCKPVGPRLGYSAGTRGGRAAGRLAVRTASRQGSLGYAVCLITRTIYVIARSLKAVN